MDEIAKAIAPNARADERVMGKLVLWMALVVVAGLANQRLWRRTPPPAAGSVTMAVVAAAREWWRWG
jgi:hypothetical protein